MDVTFASTRGSFGEDEALLSCLGLMLEAGVFVQGLNIEPNEASKLQVFAQLRQSCDIGVLKLGRRKQPCARTPRDGLSDQPSCDATDINSWPIWPLLGSSQLIPAGTDSGQTNT